MMMVMSDDGGGIRSYERWYLLWRHHLLCRGTMISTLSTGVVLRGQADQSVRSQVVRSHFGLGHFALKLDLSPLNAHPPLPWASVGL